jgi:hypothetical protein
MNNLLPHPEILNADDILEMEFEDDLKEDPYVPPFTEEMLDLDPPDEYHPKEYLIVMPSVRHIPWDFYKTLTDVSFFVCDDMDDHRPGLTGGRWNTLHHDDVEFNVFLADRDFTRSYVGEENLWLFPNKNPSVKNIGLYFAVKEGYKAVILLDDDVDCRERHVNDFLTIKRPVSTWDWSGSHDWVNTMALITYPNDDEKMFARGFPYEYRTSGCIIKRNDRLLWLAYPYFNEGLWTGHPDINGMDKLEMLRTKGDRVFAQGALFGIGEERDLPWYIDQETQVSPGQVLLRRNQNLPLSIMNCQIDAAFIPAFWQPSDYPLYNSFKIRRHDDIWSMYFLRKIMARFGADVTVGNPMVDHKKQADVTGEILSEHYTNLIQPYLTTIVDEAAEQGLSRYYGEDGNAIYASQVALAATELAQSIRIWSDWQYIPGEFVPILQNYFAHVAGWARLFGGDINPLT